MHGAHDRVDGLVLPQETVGTGAERRDDRTAIADDRQGDDLRPASTLLQFRDEVEPRDVGHPQVDDDDIDTPICGGPQIGCLGRPRDRADRGLGAERSTERLRERRVVVDHEDRRCDRVGRTVAIRDEDVGVPYHAEVPVDGGEAVSGFGAADALAGLEEVTLAVAAQSSVAEIVGAVARGAQRLPGDPAVTVGLVEDDRTLRLVSLEGFEPRIQDDWGVLDRDARLPLTDVLRDTEPKYWSSRAEMLDQYPELESTIVPSDHRSWAAVPLHAPAGSGGIIGLAFDHERRLTETERLYLYVLGKLGGEALRRAARDIERRDLVIRLAEASDRERIEIARDLHDHSVQRLAAVMIRLGSIRRDGEPPTIALVQDLETEIQAVVSSLRDLIVDLDPPDLRNVGLPTAIADFATWLFDRSVDIEYRVDLDGGVDPAIQSTAFRIVKEALTNIRKHASADSVSIDVAVEDRELRIEVSDDGAGLEGSTNPGAGHVGFRTMRERAADVGGDVRITDDDGVVVNVRLPLPD